MADLSPTERPDTDRLRDDARNAAIWPAGSASKRIRAAADEIDRLRAENAAWMNGVADAVEPLGFDRHAACGPADLLPGLGMLAAQSNPVPFPGHVRPTTDPPAVPLVADPALTYPTRGLNGPAK